MNDFSNIVKLAKKKPKVKFEKKPKKLNAKKLAKKLKTICHEYIRRRDGINGEIKGYCFDCGIYCEGQNFQAGHFESSGGHGALLRYHPLNIHGQFSGCNMAVQQERVKIAYTLKMIDTYGRSRVDALRGLKHRNIKADGVFYQRLIELYQLGDENKIITYLETYPLC